MLKPLVPPYSDWLVAARLVHPRRPRRLRLHRDKATKAAGFIQPRLNDLQLVTHVLSLYRRQHFR